MPLDAVTVSLALIAATVFVKQVLVPEVNNATKSAAATSTKKANTKKVAPDVKMHNGRPLPPSPPSDPIIGNARVMPLEYAWKTFASWSKTYGSS